MASARRINDSYRRASDCVERPFSRLSAATSMVTPQAIIAPTYEIGWKRYPPGFARFFDNTIWGIHVLPDCWQRARNRASACGLGASAEHQARWPSTD